MNPLDRTIAALAPAWAWRRARARAQLRLLDRAKELHEAKARRYEGADRGRRTQGWLAPDTSATSATRGSLHELRARCRDLDRNNPWARSAAAGLVSDIVGEGFRPKWRHPSDRVERRVAQLWADWSDCDSCDANGRSTFEAMQAATCRSMVVGGEGLVRRRFRRTEDGLPVPMQLQPLEGDFIDTFKDEETDSFGGRIVQGKSYSQIGRLQGYYLYREHPGDLFFGSTLAESVFVPASEVRHVYREDRVGQVRGIAWGAPAVVRLHDFDAYEDNEALRMVVATSFSAFVHDITADASFSDGVGGIGGPIRNDKGQVSDELEAGTIEFLPPGKTISFPTVPQNEGYRTFSRMQLLGVAKAFGTTYEALTGDYTGLPFSAARMSRLQAWALVVATRAHVILPHLCNPVVRWWLEAALIGGMLSPQELEELSYQWIPPRRELMDPRTELEADVAKVRAGFASASQVVQGYGGDIEAVYSQLARDLELARRFGLELTVDGSAPDPGRIGSVNSTSASTRRGREEPEDEEEDPEEDEEEDEEEEEDDRALARRALVNGSHGA